MTTAGSATTLQVSCGPSAAVRSAVDAAGNVPVAGVRVSQRGGPPAAAIAWIAVTWIAVTWIAVMWQRIQTAGGVVRTTLRISGTLADLAGHTAAEAEKVLVNARRALHRAVDNLTQSPGDEHHNSVPRDGETAHRGAGGPDHHHQQAPMGTAPGSNPTKEPGPGRTPDPGPQPGQNRRPDLKNRESRVARGNRTPGLPRNGA